MLRIVAGLIRPVHGRVFIGGVCVEKPAPKWSLMFQRPLRFPWLPVGANAGLGLRFAGAGGIGRRPPLAGWRARCRPAAISGRHQVAPRIVRVSEGVRVPDGGICWRSITAVFARCGRLELRNCIWRANIEGYETLDVTPRGKRSPTTTVRYRGLFANMQPLYKERVDRLDATKIERFYQQLLESGLSPTTVHHVHNVMSAAFRWAKTKKFGLITRNTLETDDVEKPRRDKSNAQAFTMEQARRALEFLTATKHANAFVFSSPAHAGGVKRAA